MPSLRGHVLVQSNSVHADSLYRTISCLPCIGVNVSPVMWPSYILLQLLLLMGCTYRGRADSGDKEASSSSPS